MCDLQRALSAAGTGVVAKRVCGSPLAPPAEGQILGIDGVGRSPRRHVGTSDKEALGQHRRRGNKGDLLSLHERALCG